MELKTGDGLAYLTDDLDGIGGELKLRPEDFIVLEELAVEPSGEGKFLYLYVQKTKRITSDVVRLFSQHFCVARDSIGYAGLKDKHAITKQWFSIEHAKEARAMEFRDEQIHILGMDQHEVGIRRGGLRGNRFDIKIRDVSAASVVRAKAVLDRVGGAQGSGVPNYVGEQRFGYRKDGHLLGRQLLLGDDQGFLDGLLGGPRAEDRDQLRAAREAYEERDYAKALSLWPTAHRFERQAVGPLSRGAPACDAVNGVDKQHRFLLVSALQSSIYNTVLDRRVSEGKFGEFLEGDVAYSHGKRNIFKVEDLDEAQRGYEAGELSPTAPMWGSAMMEASGEVGEIEREALGESGLCVEDFEKSIYDARGSRRTMRMLVEEGLVRGGGDEFGPYVGVELFLGRGSFATVVLREMMKGD